MDSCTPKSFAALSATVVEIFGAAGELCWGAIYNPNAAVAYVQLFDVATPAGVTLGTTVPKLTLGVAASAMLPLLLDRTGFVNGIQAAATTTPTGSTGPGTGLVANFGFRSGS